MARPESKALAGYFPTPLMLASSFASLVRLEPTTSEYVSQSHFDNHRIVDPCAGDGAFVEAFADALIAGHPQDTRRPEIYAVEMEQERAAQLCERLNTFRAGGRTHHGDAFNLHWNAAAATVLYLNPPYDSGRPELEFLERFTEILAPGVGALVYVVPDYALSRPAIRDYLAAHYTELRAWRFPEPHYAAFRQAVLIGRRSPCVLDIFDGSPSWADPDQLPPLPDSIGAPLSVAPRPAYMSLTMQSVDTQGALNRYVPRQAMESEDGGLPSLGVLFNDRTPVAMAPQPAHIALALASGRFNGAHLTPDNDRFPVLLAKGTFKTVHSRATEPTCSKDGKTVSWTEVERPSLEVTVLDLERNAFHTLKTGTLPTGGDDLSQWTAADLLTHYRQSLTHLLRRQFPARHKPSQPVALPTLARVPFNRQAEVIQAVLKTLATGEAALVPGEVGTGKSTIGVFIAESLKDGHRTEAVTALYRYGLAHKLPKVKRTLILAPPHLMTSWSDEIRVIVPEARIRILKGPKDLEADADYYLLSRETAKLGHAYKGLTVCSACGTASSETAATNARRRLRCETQRRIPGNLHGRLAQRLAHLLSFYAEGDLLSTLAPGRRPRTLRALTRPALDQVVSLLETSGDEDALSLAEDLAPWKSENPADSIREPAQLLKTLETLLLELATLATWSRTAPCGSPLYQAEAKPRRVALAKLIAKRYRHKFDLLLVDEAHEYAHTHSAQTIALHRLLSTGMPAVALSGSFMNGYAEGVHALFWAFSSRFRADYGRGDSTRFVKRYGYLKSQVTLSSEDDAPEAVEYGAQSDRRSRRRPIGQAPGLHPGFIFNHLLGIAHPIQKAHLEDALPPAIERRIPVQAETDMDEELLAEYKRLRQILLTQIRQDRFDPLRAGRLLGALCHVQTYLDRAFEPYRIIDPVNGAELAVGKVFPASYRTPKERSAVAYVKETLAQGEKVLFFLSNTGSGLPQRILDLLEAEGITAKFLDARKVSAAKRQAWIDTHVNRQNVPVLIVNPAAVQTGLNNLKAFSRAYWYQWTYSAIIYRQANGRIHRIGQTRSVEFAVPFYAGTTQSLAVDLVASKVSASLQFDGLDIQGALEAAGAGDDASNLGAALSIGQAVYDSLERLAA